MFFAWSTKVSNVTTPLHFPRARTTQVIKGSSAVFDTRDPKLIDMQTHSRITLNNL
jgi:hypothetical protein